MSETIDVRVKALEWQTNGEVWWVRGDAPRYEVGPQMSWGCKLHFGGSLIGSPTGDWFLSQGAAKAAAQADYDCRIRSALEPAPKPAGGEPAVWQPKYSAEVIEHHRTQVSSFGEYAGVVYPTKEEAESYGLGGHEVRPLYAAPPAPAASPSGGEVATHRHKKRGSEYVLIGIGKMQSEFWEERTDGTIDRPSHMESVDMREVAIYRSVDDGSLWVRPREEFEDGRFEPLPAAPSSAPPPPSADEQDVGELIASIKRLSHITISDPEDAYGISDKAYVELAQVLSAIKRSTTDGL